MISITINGVEKELASATESWINESINGPKSAGQSVCVQVRIVLPDVQVLLSTPTCPGGFGGGRPPNEKELWIIDLWNKRELNQTDFNGGNLNAFLKQVPQD